MTKIAGITSTDTAKLEAELEQIEKLRTDVQRQLQVALNEQRSYNSQIQELSTKIDEIKGELLARRTPFKKGDIVLDDEGVRYRVHAVYRSQAYVNNTIAQAGTVYGIRLTKTGTEAYAKPREIVSSKPLVKEAQ